MDLKSAARARQITAARRHRVSLCLFDASSPRPFQRPLSSNFGFPHAIRHFYSCPFGGLLSNRQRLKKLGLKLRELKRRTDSLEQRRAAHELLQIIHWADTGVRSGNVSWFECSGDHVSIAPPGFASVDIATILPPNRAKGIYIDQIERQDGMVLGSPNENEISLALQFTFQAVTIVLGGDGTRTNWGLRRRYENDRGRPIAARVVNLPHHGSAYDCDASVLTQLFGNSGDRVGISSGNGLTHPDLEVIEWLERNQIWPYCTNLIPACGANIKRLLALNGYDPTLARWMREVADAPGQIQPCQGDVTVRIEDNGSVSTTPQYANSCGYRGDFDLLKA